MKIYKAWKAFDRMEATGKKPARTLNKVMRAMNKHANKLFMRRWKELVKCPECDTIQNATVTFRAFFPTYLHDCKNCGYVIMESEWESVTKPTNSRDTTIKSKELNYEHGKRQRNRTIKG